MSIAETPADEEQHRAEQKQRQHRHREHWAAGHSGDGDRQHAQDEIGHRGPDGGPIKLWINSWRWGGSDASWAIWISRSWASPIVIGLSVQ